MLKRLLGRHKASGVEQQKAPRLSPSLSAAIMRAVGKRSIPPMPAAAQRAFRLSVDPNAAARDFVEVIEGDEALSARVIKIANSVYFERGKKSETIEDSVHVIGVNELRNLLCATALSDIFPTKHPARVQLWANDIATALAAKILAPRLSSTKPDSAFLAGLMHDIGKLLLLQRIPEMYPEVVNEAAKTGEGFCEIEERHFVFNHTEVGQLVAEHWNFSEELIAVIRNHHAPWKAAEQKNLSLAEVVQIADTVCHALGLGHRPGFGAFQNSAREKLEGIFDSVGVPTQERQGVLQLVQRTFEVEKDLYQRTTPL